jgi:hypothetical protein
VESSGESVGESAGESMGDSVCDTLGFDDISPRSAESGDDANDESPRSLRVPARDA